MQSSVDWGMKASRAIPRGDELPPHKNGIWSHFELMKVKFGFGHKVLDAFLLFDSTEVQNWETFTTEKKVKSNYKFDYKSLNMVIE